MIVHGDCIEAMREMPEASVDAVVTDPPYLIGFMSKSFDMQGGAHVSPKMAQAWHEVWATEALRVLKPGGHMLAAGSSRTFHRLVCAIEDAGFEVRDTITHFHSVKTEGIMDAWLRWSRDALNAGVNFREVDDGSAPGTVLLATSLENSPAGALIAELRSSEAHHTDAGSWRSALFDADGRTTGSSALVTIAGALPASRDATSTEDSSAPTPAPAWLDASMEARRRAVEALRIWLGSEQSSKQAATDALCVALTDALKAITCAQSETFQSYDTTSRMVCVSATTVTTTASTAASLLAYMVATLEAEGGDAREVPGGPLVWVYGSGFP